MESISLVPSIQRKLDDIQQYGNEPILLEGPIGAGKTTLVEYLASALRKTLIKVQLGDGSDSKSILGAYCCGEVPGLFYWRNSALLEAMLEGHWLLLEDFDQAQVDVYGVLMPLLESGSLLVPELGNEIVRAKEGFRLFATSRLIETSGGFIRIKINPHFDSAAKFFSRITVEPMQVEELSKMVSRIYKFKNCDIKILVNTYLELTKIYKHKHNFTTRNLIKWCERISRFSDTTKTNSLIALEAFDVFAGAIQSKADQQEMKNVIGKLIDDNNQTCIRITDTLIQVGKYELKSHGKISDNVERETPKFRFNMDTYCLLENIAGCVVINKPVLLIGKTNKMNFIQFLSDNMNAKLKVLNFNESFASDLPGVYDPSVYESTYALVIDLMRKFKKLAHSKALHNKYKKLVKQMEVCCATAHFREMLNKMREMIPNMINMYKEGQKAYKQWTDISDDINQAETSLNENPLFTVIEESVVLAVKNGEWLILDDVNVGVLKSISGLLETKCESINLAIRGKLPAIPKHDNFRIFVCMSSAQEKELSKMPSDLKNCFSEFHVTDSTKFIDDEFESTTSLFRARKVLVNEIEIIIEFKQLVNTKFQSQSQAKVKENKIHVGRYELERFCGPDVIRNTSKLAYTSQSICLLEYIAGCISNNEPLLLVGETGTGKTSTVQFLANLMNANLRVVNMNQQSDSSDLLGAYRPISAKELVTPLWMKFKKILNSMDIQNKNVYNIKEMEACFMNEQLKVVFSKMKVMVTSVCRLIEEGSESHKALIDVSNGITRMENSANNGPAFSFIEGTLVKAIRNGDWILLDEINLADADILESLCGLLESKKGSVTLASRGGQDSVVTHKNFRIFGCMNPGQDFGKKELPLSLRNRFTEFFVNEASSLNDLRIMVKYYLQNIDDHIIDGIVSFYMKVRNISSLCDGVGKKPLFSMRTLCRALRIARELTYGAINRSIYEGFSVSFLTQLNSFSYSVMETIIREEILQNMVIEDAPDLQDGFVLCQEYQIAKGTLLPQIDPKYIITPSVENNLRDLARAVAARRLPVLIQGETSVGKTSMITYLARATGNICYRINNHEYTDVQEYMGTYTSDSNGQLVFKEGALVEAMRKGYWIILDELNLAPSEVLEALNRLLDDNRELFLPETQEVVKAHEKFLVFATQNPPGRYGGRKELSKAFRNRFLEMHFHTIPQDELVTILAKKIGISETFSKEMVEIMCELQNIRDSSNMFSNKDGLITMRELFRWAERFKKAKETDPDKDDYEILADQGYLLLVGKVRKDSDKERIRHAISERLNREINEERLFGTSVGVCPAGFEHVVMTKAMKRIAVLVSEALTHKEPVLLVGETGCGKTTVTQMFAKLQNFDLLTLNCHLHTETSDFLGGLRPVRNTKENCNRLFEWCDGPLIKAMKNGAIFLVDEISLAEDSVLERLNSVLEPERKLLLVECGGNNESEGSLQIDALDNFRIVGTMNPGGDFGKKELSPALRNRFTEIWCSQSTEKEDLAKIIVHNLKNGLLKDVIADQMVNFVLWMKEQQLTRRTVVSIRDLLSWVLFINVTADSDDKDVLTSFLRPEMAYIHGALMVFVDALQPDQVKAKDMLLQYLCDQVQYNKDEIESIFRSNFVVNSDSKFFQMNSFKIPRGPIVDHCAHKFAFDAPTTSSNAVRVMRALQLHRPILLEGSPGVGKTSLVMALAKASGNSIVRINLSDQTEISDLFGADLPKNGGKCGKFKWVDGPLLAGLKAGHWIVLDELNLATQSVLEGLNACLDHRAEVFIPELSQTFKIDHKRTRIFACQNPLSEGGDRKGLPKSFLNRFNQVYLDQLTFDDLFFILKTVNPEFSEETLTRMVTFNMKINQNMNQSNKIGALDFNLRDMMRWCQLCKINKDIENPCRYVDVIYMMRLRTMKDRQEAEVIFKEVFQEDYSEYIPSSAHLVTDSLVQVGHSFLRRCQDNYSSATSDNKHPLRFLQSNNRTFSSLIECVNMNWMAIMVGPSGCGKTSLLKMVSHLSGNLLHTMPMNTSMDTAELLGSFEQESFRKKIESFTEQWSMVVENLNHECGQQLVELWAEFVNSQKAITLQKEEIGTSEMGVEILERIKCALIPITKQISDETFCSELEDAVSSMQDSCSKLECGRFQWVDSLLLTCMKKGWWIVLDNINFCSASVLDRLNSVLEPNGVLTLDELGASDDGKIPEITPHPNFRIFVTMDPKNGEISRAMRNRGIEICMTPITTNGSSSLEDLTGLIHDSGINPTSIQKVQHFHKEAQQQGLTSDVRSLIRACRLTKMGMSSKINKNRVQSMKNAFLLTYVNGCYDNKSKKKFSILIKSLIESEESSHPMNSLPLPNLDEYLQNVDVASVGKMSVQLKRTMHSIATKSHINEDLNIVSIVAVQSSSVNALKLLPSNLGYHLNDGSCEANKNLRQIVERVIKILSSLSDHKLIDLFVETLGNSPDKHQLPMNIYRNSDLVRFSGLSEIAVKILRNIYNQIPYIMKCEIIASDLKEAITDADSLETNSAQPNSLIQWAKHHCSGLIQSDSISQLVLYIKLATDDLKEALTVFLDWDDEFNNQVSEGMGWLLKLVNCLSTEISSNKLNEALMHAWLFATWANMRLEKMFKNSFSSQLSNVIEALNKSHICSKQIDKFHIAAMNLYGWSKGCKNESEANLCQKAKALLNSYFVVEDHTLNNINLAHTSKLLRFLSNENVNRIKQQLLNFLADPSSDADFNQQMLEDERLRIYRDDSLYYNFPTSFQLIPIRSYFLSCHSGVLLLRMLTQSLPNYDHLKRLADMTSRTLANNDFYSLAECNYYNLLGNPSKSFLFQLISNHLDSFKSNVAAIALSNLLENLESDGISKNHDYLKSQESKSNLLSGFSSAVIRIIDSDLRFKCKSDCKTSMTSNCSWLLSSIQLKHAARKLYIARSLEEHLWSYLANQELNNWDNLSNNLMILEHCVDIVSTLMNRLLPMLDKNGSLFEIVFSMAKSYLGKAKIEAPGQPSFCSMGMSLGMAWLCLGQLQFLMLCPKEGSFDSLGIATIELDGLQKMVRDIKKEIIIRETHAILHGGDGGDGDIERLKSHLVTLEEKIKELPQLYRPTPSQYPELCKEMSELSNEFFTSEKMINAAQNLILAFELCQNTSQRSDFARLSPLLDGLQNMLGHISQFMKTFESRYYLYHDLTTNLMSALKQCKFGIDTLVSSVETEMGRMELSRDISVDVDQLASSLMAFPMASSSQINVLEMVDLFLSEDFHTLLQRIESKSGTDLINRILKACSMLLLNSSKISPNHPNLFCQLNRLANIYHSRWIEEEEEKESRRANDQCKMDFSILSFDRIFSQSMKLDGPYKWKSIHFISDEDFEFFVFVYFQIMGKERLDDTENGKSEFEIDWFPYCNVIHHLTSDIFKDMTHLLNPKIERMLVAHHLLTLCLIQSSLEGKQTSESKENVNINIVECQKVLEDVMAELQLKLVQIPDNLTLIQLKSYIERLLTYPVTSPAMKFAFSLHTIVRNTQTLGSELFRSLKLNKVLELVKKWRVIEISAWKSSMNSVEMKHQSVLWRRFFSILGHIKYYLEEPPRIEEMQILEAIRMSSKFGDFKPELRMLLSLHHYMRHLSANVSENNGHCKEATDKLATIFRNAYDMNSQYLPYIENMMSASRNKMEDTVDQLKDSEFSKINKAMDDSCKSYSQALNDNCHKYFGFIRIAALTNDELVDDQMIMTQSSSSCLNSKIFKVEPRHCKSETMKKIISYSLNVIDQIDLKDSIINLELLNGELIEILKSAVQNGNESVAEMNERLSILFEDLKALGVDHIKAFKCLSTTNDEDTKGLLLSLYQGNPIPKCIVGEHEDESDNFLATQLKECFKNAQISLAERTHYLESHKNQSNEGQYEIQEEDYSSLVDNLRNRLADNLTNVQQLKIHLIDINNMVDESADGSVLPAQDMIKTWKAKAEELHLLLVEYLHQLHYVVDTVALTSSIRDDENEDDNAFTSLIVESNSAINKDDYVSVKVIIEECFEELECGNIHNSDCKEGVAVVKLFWVERLFEKLKKVLKRLRIIEDKLSIVKEVSKRVNKSPISAQPLIELIETNLDGFKKFRKSSFNGQTELMETDDSNKLKMLKASCQSLASFCLKRVEQVLAIVNSRDEDEGRQLIPNLGSGLKMILKTLDVTEVNNHLSLIISTMCDLASQRKSSNCMSLAMQSLTEITGTLKQYSKLVDFIAILQVSALKEMTKLEALLLICLQMSTKQEKHGFDSSSIFEAANCLKKSGKSNTRSSQARVGNQNGIAGAKKNNLSDAKKCNIDNKSSSAKNAPNNSLDKDGSIDVKSNSDKCNTAGNSKGERISSDGRNGTLSDKDSHAEVKNKDDIKDSSFANISRKNQFENELDKYDYLIGKVLDNYNSENAISFKKSLNSKSRRNVPNEDPDDLDKIVRPLNGDWDKYTKRTTYMTQKLSEQLRTILDPNQANKMKGGYKTGKRIDMKKVIQYIASDFRKDRIWLKRTKPCQRNYQIILGIDDSGSMGNNKVKELTLQSLAIVMNALTQVGIKDVGVCSFGQTVKILHPLGKPFSAQCGNGILKNLTFSQPIEQVSKMVETSMSMFAERGQSAGTSSSSVPNKLLLMVTDGVIRDKMQHHEAIARATNEDIFVATVITRADNASRKVRATNSNGMFQFPYHLVINDANELPQAMADSLRQWFEYTS